MNTLLLLLLVGCGDPLGPEPVCPWSTVAKKYLPGEGPARVVEGTSLLACEADGRLQDRWVERYTAGGVAAEGFAGPTGTHGLVTVWAENGAFVSSETWVDGVLRGPRRFVGADGRVVEVEVLTAASADAPEVIADMRVFPAGAPMDEWVELRRVPGVGYRNLGETSGTSALPPQ